jgi:hypothetical protein
MMRLLLFVKECGEWGWMREAPPSRKTGKGSSESVQKRKQLSIQQRLLKGEVASCALIVVHIWVGTVKGF